MDNLIERIQEMEELYNKAEESINTFEKSLKEFKGSLENINALESYYFSPQWQQDKHSDREGKIPKNIRSGVLSEDGIWNTSVRYHDLGVDLIRLGLSLIERK